MKMIFNTLSNIKIINTKETLNTYNIDRCKICNGKFGILKRAYNTKLKKYFAIKIIKKTYNIEDDDKIINEINIMKNIDHPNIIHFQNNFEDKLNYYIVMELFPGKDLLEVLLEEEKNTFEEKKTLQIMKIIINAVAYLHYKKIVHRDIKLENIMYKEINNNMIIKLIDFGLSKQIDDDNEKMEDFVGTGCYIPPEIVNRKMYNKSIDIYSSGIVFYLILHGSLPFIGKDNNETYYNICYTDLKFHKNINENIKELIVDMTNKQYFLRPTLLQIIDRIENLL